MFLCCCHSALRRAEPSISDSDHVCREVYGQKLQYEHYAVRSKYSCRFGEGRRNGSGRPTYVRQTQSMFPQPLTKIQARNDGIGFPRQIRVQTPSVTSICPSLELVSNHIVIDGDNATS